MRYYLAMTGKSVLAAALASGVFLLLLALAWSCYMLWSAVTP